MRTKLIVLALFFAGVVSIGLVGCDGDDDNGGEVSNANAKFYGIYSGTITYGTCVPEDISFTIGGDVQRAEEDEYFYLPANSDSATHSGNEGGFEFSETYVVSGDSIFYNSVVHWGDDPVYTREDEGAWVFSDDYQTITVTGTVSIDDPDWACANGATSGTLTRI